MKALKKIDKTQRFLIIIILVYCTIVAVRNPAFLSLTTLFNMVRSSAGTTILAMGVLVVMISGGIDVSFPAIAIFGGYTSLRLCMSLQIEMHFCHILNLHSDRHSARPYQCSFNQCPKIRAIYYYTGNCKRIFRNYDHPHRNKKCRCK